MMPYDIMDLIDILSKLFQAKMVYNLLRAQPLSKPMLTLTHVTNSVKF